MEKKEGQLSPYKPETQRSIALTFRGFDYSPEQVENLVGKSASLKGTLGMPVKLSVKTLLQKSFVRYELNFEEDVELCEMLQPLFVQLGGVDHICNVRDTVLPEFTEVDIVLPIKLSNKQENGYFELEDLSNLCKLRATLGFSFL